MMTLYCDESDDGETYALAGWLGVPTGWYYFEPAWREMLQTIRMPDGSPCPAFHAVDIVNRDHITDSPFRGWSFQDEVQAFTKVTDLIIDKTKCALMWPIGAAVRIPSTFKGPRDSIWLMLFGKLCILFGQMYPAQRSINFIFDEKDSIATQAVAIHDAAKIAFERHLREEYLTTIEFHDDARVVPLQAADLLAYEWRKRITDETLSPEKPVRRSFQRIRAGRNEGALRRYGTLFNEIPEVDQLSVNVNQSYYRWFFEREPTHID